MAKVNSLYKLICALSGQEFVEGAVDSYSIAPLLDKLADDVNNGDLVLVPASTVTGLPAVTAEDNGKILKVVNGEWALADDATE